MLKKKIDEIADILISHKVNCSIDLLGGKSGIALFLFYYYKLTDSSIAQTTAHQLIDECVVGDFSGSMNFGSGLSGLCWVIEHAKSLSMLDIEEDFFEEIDPNIANYMKFFINNSNFDFLHGAIGCGLFQLCRIKEANNELQIRKLIDGLETRSIRNGEKIMWKYRFPNSNYCYSLGLSHGIPAIVMLLNKIYKVGLERKKVLQLIKGSINYILSCSIDNERFFFPSFADINGSSEALNSRLGWCYGDLSVGYCLLRTSQILEDVNLYEKAIGVLIQASYRRDLINEGVHDAGLCHGASGILHIFHKLFKETQIVEFSIASNFWLKQTLSLAKFENGLAGYKTMRNYSPVEWSNDYGFLEGIAGIGLALISVYSDIEPKWDESLLLS